MQASAATAVKDFRDDAGARFLRFDPLMLVATIGLIAASVYIVGNATPGRHPGRPQLLPLQAGRVRRRRVAADAPA